jgi:DNA-directed RNA polymerase subunit K/omega
MESAYDEIGEVLGKYYEIKEGNEFGAARAKAIAAGEDSFEVDGKSYKVTDVDDSDKKNAEEFTNESVNEEEIKWNAVQNAIINFLKANTKILDKRVQAKDTEGVKGGLKSIISGLTNAQRSLNLESVNEASYTVKAENPYQFVNGAYAVLNAYLRDEELGPKGKRELQSILKSLDYMRKYFYSNMNESVNEEEMEEGNEFGAARAKAIAAGQDTFQVGDKTFKVTDVDAEDKENAEDFANESMKLTSLIKSKKSVNEGAHGMATKLVQSVINGQTSRVEGIPLSKPMAEAFMNWLRLSTYGRNYKDLPFYMLLRASFHWGLNRYIDSSLKAEYVKLSKLVADIEKKRKEKKA